MVAAAAAEEAAAAAVIGVYDSVLCVEFQQNVPTEMAPSEVP